jgi:hypothetical protein
MTHDCRCYRTYSVELQELHNKAFRLSKGIECEKDIIAAIDLYTEAMLKGHKDSHNNFYILLRRAVSFKKNNIENEDCDTLIKYLPNYLICKKLPNNELDTILKAIFLDNIEYFYELFLLNETVLNEYSSLLKKNIIFDMVKHDIIHNKIKTDDLTMDRIKKILLFIP